MSDIPNDRIDELTGLANVNGLAAWLAEKTPLRPQDDVVVLTVALDGFAAVKKTRGNDIADAVLREVAQRVGSSVGHEGVAARTGETEFVALLRTDSRTDDAVAEHAGRLSEMLQRPAELPQGVIWIGGSVGAALGSLVASGDTLERSRMALHKAQRLGRGHFVVQPLPAGT